MRSLIIKTLIKIAFWQPLMERRYIRRLHRLASCDRTFAKPFRNMIDNGHKRVINYIFIYAVEVICLKLRQSCYQIASLTSSYFSDSWSLCTARLLTLQSVIIIVESVGQCNEWDTAPNWALNKRERGREREKERDNGSMEAIYIRVFMVIQCNYKTPHYTRR
jgi:hypothetical protein